MNSGRCGERRRRTRIDGQFAPRLIDILRSPAMSALSLSARRMLDRIEIELASHGGTDNGKLPVTYDDFYTFGIHRHAIAPGMRELVALGFIEITERGRAGNAEYRRPNLFRLTYRDLNRAAPTHEWRRIKTEEEARRVAQAARTAQPKHRRPRAASAKTKASDRKRQFAVTRTYTETANSIVHKSSLL
jgi:hypothetical protein